MNYYPISLNLNHKLCIVVGGGTVALRKVSKLLNSGAVVKVISPTLQDKLQALLETSLESSWVKASYTSGKDLKGASLVFAATNDPATNQQVLEDARALGIFTNMTSQGELGDFIVPASFNRGDLELSISTGGKVPGLSKAIKETLEDTLGPEYAILINRLEEIRRSKDHDLLAQMTATYLDLLETIKS